MVQSESSGFVFKLPPDYGEGYPKVVMKTTISFIYQQRKNKSTVNSVNSLLRLLKKFVENELGKTLTEDIAIDSTTAPSSLSELSHATFLPNKMKMFISNSCVHILLKLGIISDLNSSPIQVSLF